MALAILVEGQVSGRQMFVVLPKAGEVGKKPFAT